MIIRVKSYSKVKLLKFLMCLDMQFITIRNQRINFVPRFQSRFVRDTCSFFNRIIKTG